MRWTSAGPLVLWLGLCGLARGAPPEEPEEDDGPSKRALWQKDKAGRKQVRARRPPAKAALEVISLRNLWTGEVLPLRKDDPAKTTWDVFLRCHHTNQCANMDLRLVGLLRAVATHFQAQLIDVVSGFRAPKYNLMLRKKGHAVARDSQHTQGSAIDFRVAGVPVGDLRRFVLAHRLGGVGFYPRSEFVHADTGPVRTWIGE